MIMIDKSRHPKRTLFTLCLLSLGMLLPEFVPISNAERLPQEPILPLALAQKAAEAALVKCEEGGYKVSVAVVDRGGNLRVLLRGDGAGPHTVDSSSRKAYTSASLGRSTEHLAQLLSKFPNIQGLREMNEKILILGGGLPVELQGEVVAGIGVGGAPGAHLDEACALAGLKRIGAEPKGGQENEPT